MKLTWQKRKRITEMVKGISIYILLIGLTASITLNYMLYKEPLSSVSTNTVKESLKDIEIKYVDRKEYLYFDNENNEWQEFTVTGYTQYDEGCNNIVATGFDLDQANVKRLPICASNCIPIYTIIEIEGLGPYIILDTGLGYKTDYGWEDENWIDILFETQEEAIEFGKRKLKVRILGKVDE